MVRLFVQFLIAFLLPVLAGLVLPEIKPATHSGNATPSTTFEPRNIPGVYTGGFGEQTCHSCHFNFDLNPESGSLTVEGLGEIYTPGEQWEITVTVEHEQLEIGGFQMAARFEDGTQAGMFKWQEDDSTLAFTRDTGNDIQYIQHSESGTGTTSEGKLSWSFTWTAPMEASGPVIFNIAANAGNDDFSPLGDWVYVKEFTVVNDQ